METLLNPGFGEALQSLLRQSPFCAVGIRAWTKEEVHWSPGLKASKVVQRESLRHGSLSENCPKVGPFDHIWSILGEVRWAQKLLAIPHAGNSSSSSSQGGGLSFAPRQMNWMSSMCVFFTLLGWFFSGWKSTKKPWGFCSQMFFPAKYPLTNPMTFGGWLGKNDKNDLRPKCVCMSTWPIQFFCMTNPGQSNPLTNPVFFASSYSRHNFPHNDGRMNNDTVVTVTVYCCYHIISHLFLHFFCPFFQIATPIFLWFTSYCIPSPLALGQLEVALTDLRGDSAAQQTRLSRAHPLNAEKRLPVWG